MSWVIAVLVAAVALGLAAPRPPAMSKRRQPFVPVPFEQEEDLVEQLRRHGTPEDAQRLIADGRGDDLAGLGYRPD